MGEGVNRAPMTSSWTEDTEGHGYSSAAQEEECWGGAARSTMLPRHRTPLLVGQIGFHADQDDLTALAPEHGSACLLILQKPIGGCDVLDHIDLHVPSCEAGRPGRQALLVSLLLGLLSLPSLPTTSASEDREGRI